MPRGTRFRRAIGQHIRGMQLEGLSVRYVQQHQQTLLKFEEFCLGRGIASVGRIEEQDVRDFIRSYSSFSLSYQKINATVVRKFLRANRHPAHELRLKMSGSSRTKVDWLSDEECERIFSTPMKPAEAVLILAGLLQGMRRIETLRLTMRDVRTALRTRVIRLQGKGWKERSVPLQEDFARTLEAYLATRSDAPDGEPLLPFGRRRSEDHLENFCKRMEKRFGFHTLRRTFGRQLWLRGVPIETISELYGHSSTDMTRLYIGLNISDMRSALAKLTCTPSIHFPVKPER